MTLPAAASTYALPERCRQHVRVYGCTFPVHAREGLQMPAEATGLLAAHAPSDN